VPRKQHPPSALIAELRAARLEQGLTQEEVADAVGCHRASIRDWESRYNVPLLSSAEAWARVLGRRLTWGPVGVDVSALLADLDDED
jgi:transcriptional regulator with XRE-family HTH domain